MLRATQGQPVQRLDADPRLRRLSERVRRVPGGGCCAGRSRAGGGKAPSESPGARLPSGRGFVTSMRKDIMLISYHSGCNRVVWSPALPPGRNALRSPVSQCTLTRCRAQICCGDWRLLPAFRGTRTRRHGCFGPRHRDAFTPQQPCAAVRSDAESNLRSDCRGGARNDACFFAPDADARGAAGSVCGSKPGMFATGAPGMTS